MQTIKLRQIDDMHLHLRDGQYLTRTVPDAAKQVARAIIMPNLRLPVTTVADALAYRERILQHMPNDCAFEPMMTLYLTDTTSVDTIKEAADNPFIHACKLYPAGATTHSDAGVHSLEKLYPILESMQTHNLRLLIHGEVTEAAIDIFDREAVFIDRHLAPLVNEFSELKIVLEHITTQYAADFILQSPDNIAATITAHHLLINRSDMLAGGIKPHLYCLPVVKRERDRLALLQAATSGNQKFFLGSDSAPHALSQKETACGCAGIYTAHALMSLYAQAFESVDKLENLDAFASQFGAAFYGLPRNEKTITLTKKAWQVPASLSFADSELIPFAAGQTLEWNIDEY